MFLFGHFTFTEIVEAAKNRHRLVNNGAPTKAASKRVVEDDETEKETEKDTSSKNCSCDNTSLSSDSCSSVEFEWKDLTKAKNTSHALMKSESMPHKPTVIEKVNRCSSFENVNRKTQNVNFLTVSKPTEVHSDSRNRSPVSLNEGHTKYRRRTRTRTAASNCHDESSSDYDDCLVNSLVRYHSDETLNRAKNSKIQLRTQRYYQRKSHEFLTHSAANFSKPVEPKPKEQLSGAESLSSPSATAKTPSVFVTFDWVNSGAYSSKDPAHLAKSKPSQSGSALSANPIVDFRCFDDILPPKPVNMLKKEPNQPAQKYTLDNMLTITTATSQPILSHFSPTNDSGVSSQSLASSPIFNLPPSPPFRPSSHQASLNSSQPQTNLSSSNVNSSSGLVNGSNKLVNGQQRNHDHNVPHLPPSFPVKTQSSFQRPFPPNKGSTVKRAKRLSVKDMVANIEKGIKPSDRAPSPVFSIQYECGEDALRRVSSASKIQDFSNALNRQSLGRLIHNSSNYNGCNNLNGFYQNGSCVQNGLSQESYNNNEHEPKKSFQKSCAYNSYNQNGNNQNKFEHNGYVQSNLGQRKYNDFKNGVDEREKILRIRFNSQHSPTFYETKRDLSSTSPSKMSPTILNVKNSSNKPDKFLQNAKYKPHPDKRYSNLDEAINDLERIYESLKLNDEDLLERAERRDMPSKFQLMRLNSDNSLNCDQNYNYIKQTSIPSKDLGTCLPHCDDYEKRLSLGTVEAFLASRDPRNRYRAPPLRRSAIHDRVNDDLLVRKLNFKANKNSKISPNVANQTSSYLLYSNLYTPTIDVEEVYKDFTTEPDIAKDDLSYRKIVQSDGANVAPAHPPFGIPIGVTELSTFNNYIRANLDPKERNKVYYRYKPKSPHLIRDDLAYRTYRNDLNDNERSTSMLPVTTQHVLNEYKKDSINRSYSDNFFVDKRRARDWETSHHYSNYNNNNNLQMDNNLIC